MPFDPTKPVGGTQVNSTEMRAQLIGLFEVAQARAFEDDCINRTLGSARNPGGVAALGLTISDPPTQAEMQSVSDKLDELLAALKRP